jgi:7-cyano-7-deazaguanine synthase
MKVLAVVSGGLDSTTMVYDALANGMEVDLISFDYGQRHKKELIFARAIASMLSLRHDIVDLTGLTHLISNSALTSKNSWRPEVEGDKPKIEVPEGHYAEDTMKLTVVPNRNMIMLSIAAGVAVNRGMNTIATAVHAGDHFVYPDCRPEFIAATAQAIHLGNDGFSNFAENAVIAAPFLNSTKADIAERAFDLNVPLHMTWSCYVGGTNHCGRCGTCVERLEAIDEGLRRHNQKQPSGTWLETRLADLTTYDDDEYWKAVTKKKVETVSDASDYDNLNDQIHS